MPRSQAIKSLSQPIGQRHAALLCGSAAFHVVVMAILGLNLAGRYDQVPFAGEIPLFLDIEPRPFLRGETTRRSALPAAPLAEAPARPANRSDEGEDEALSPPNLFDIQPAPRSATPAATLDATIPTSPGQGQAPAVRPNRGGDVCRDLSNFAAWEAARCRDRGRVVAQGPGEDAAHLDEVAEARLGRRRGSAAERRREEGFARQAAANDAWRAYTRDEGDYPGLRSLFTQH